MPGIARDARRVRRAPRRPIRHRRRELPETRSLRIELAKWVSRYPFPVEQHSNQTGLSLSYFWVPNFVADLSKQSFQLRPQLARRAEQGVLHSLFRGAQRVADRAQLQPLIMFHLKHHPFTRRKQIKCGGNSPANLEPPHAAFGIRERSLILLPVEEIAGHSISIQIGRKFRRLIFRTAASAAQMIEAYVGDDPVRPSIEAALEAETWQIFIDFQERFLVNIAGIFGLAQNIQGNSQDIAG